MKRTVLMICTVLTLAAAAACAGGDKKAATPTTTTPAEATATVAAETTVTATAARSTPIASVDSTPAADRALGGIFQTLFSSGALGGAGRAGDPAALNGGDPKLLDYLLKESELPGGFTGYTQFTSRVPDGLSKGATVDVAASMATRGDALADDPKQIAILMSMVIKPQDLQELGASFDAAKGLTDADLRDAIAASAGGAGGLDIAEAHILDAPDLGDGSFGMSMSIDLSVLAGLFGTPEAGSGSPVIPVLRMRLYMFAEGDYAGGIVRVGFGDGLDGDAEDLALARVVDAKLKGAP